MLAAKFTASRKAVLSFKTPICNSPKIISTVSVIGTAKKKKKNMHGKFEATPNSNGGFFVFRQCFLFQQWTVFPFFHKLFRLYFQQYNRNLVLYRRFTLNTWKYLDSFGYYSVLWCCMAYSTCVSCHKSINSHLIENTWQWWGRRGGYLVNPVTLQNCFGNTCKSVALSNN